MTTTTTTKRPASISEREAAAAKLAAAEAAEQSARAEAQAARAQVAEIDGRARRVAFEGLAADIDAASDPAALVEAMDGAEAAIARLLGVLDARDKRITGWVAELRELGVAQTAHGGTRAEDDYGFGWRPSEGAMVLLTPQKPLRPIAPLPLLDAVVARGLSAAGKNPRQIMAGAPTATADVLADPGKWARDRW